MNTSIAGCVINDGECGGLLAFLSAAVNNERYFILAAAAVTDNRRARAKQV